MYIEGMEITYVLISQLKHNDKNPRSINKDQFEKLCKNIKSDPEYFEMRPILVNATSEGLIVYAGNQRLRAARKLGMREVPAIVTNDVDPELLRKRVVLDNLHNGEHDFELLSALYDPHELIEWGMHAKELDLSFLDEDKPAKEEKQCEKCEACGQKLKKKK